MGGQHPDRGGDGARRVEALDPRVGPQHVEGEAAAAQLVEEVGLGGRALAGDQPDPQRREWEGVGGVGAEQPLAPEPGQQLGTGQLELAERVRRVDRRHPELELGQRRDQYPGGLDVGVGVGEQLAGRVTLVPLHGEREVLAGDRAAAVRLHAVLHDAGAEPAGDDADRAQHEHLALGQLRVQHPAGVMDRDVVPHGHLAGGRVDFDDRHVGQEAVGRRRVDRVVGRRRIEPRHRNVAVRASPSSSSEGTRIPVAGPGDPAEGDRPVGVPTTRRSHGELHVRRRALEQLAATTGSGRPARGGGVDGAGDRHGEAAGVVTRADREGAGGGVGAGVDRHVLRAHARGRRPTIPAATVRWPWPWGWT